MTAANPPETGTSNHDHTLESRGIVSIARCKERAAGGCPTQGGLMEAEIQGVMTRRTPVHRACDQATFSAAGHL
jgi:hypothetical protein